MGARDAVDVSEGQEVVVAGVPHRVQATGGERVPYTLIGPRGGQIDVIRDIKNKGVLFLLRGDRLLPGCATDDGGKFVYMPNALVPKREH
jgi:hypothetical protein